MKVLILAHDFPPLVSIGGLRPFSWYNYFAAFGTDVTVITRNWNEGDNTEKSQPAQNTSVLLQPPTNRILIEVTFLQGMKERLATRLKADKFRRLGQAITYIFCYLEFLSLRCDSTSPLYYEADALLQKEKFDFIIATGKPFILFRYASLLSAKYNTAWVADYRDSWTMNHIQGNYSIGILGSLLNGFYKLMEKKYLPNASLVTTVAPSYIDLLPGYISRDKIKVMYNGYDDEVAKLVEGLPISKTKFIISYAGLIYTMQHIEVFLEALCIFLKDNDVAPEEFEVHFWGVKNDVNAVSRIMNYNPALHPYIQLHYKIGYFEVMKKISNSHLLLLLTGSSDSWLNAKLFDYLVLKRAILMIGKNTNIMSAILKETNGGFVAENARAAANYIALQFKGYKQAKPHETINYAQFSRKNQTGRFYAMLKNLM